MATETTHQRGRRRGSLLSRTRSVVSSMVHIRSHSADLASSFWRKSTRQRSQLLPLNMLSELWLTSSALCSVIGLKVARSSFIEQAFQKRECCVFIPSVKDKLRCGCGRSLSHHEKSGVPSIREANSTNFSQTKDRWTISKHTVSAPTDAYGTIEFQGGPHPRKAQFVRLSFDSDPEQLLYLFEKIWKIEQPKLVISVHGGIDNFNLQQKVARVFRKGLLKAAKTTGAWIITSGTDSGVVRHVASALSDGGGHRSKKRVATIGIVPWGLLQNQEDFIGKEVTVPYHPQAFGQKGRFGVLNDKHSYFLLVDNGTVGRYGADIVLRKRFEDYICKLRIES